MAFTPQFLDELRARTGLAEVVSRRVKLTRKGHEHLGLCPFHKEKTPSFTLNEEKGFYHCFGCGAHGSAFDFVMQTEGLSFPEAVERLAGDAGMEVPVDTPQERERALRNQSLYDVMEQAAAVYEKTLRMPEGRPALNYLKGRGLGDETLTRFRLGFAPDSRGFLKTALARENISEGQMIEAGLLIRPEDSGRDSYDRFRGRIMFPITDRRGRVIAFGGRILGDGEPKYLNSPETPLFHKGRTLYALSLAGKEIRAKGEAVVSEGYMDVIALHQAGFLTAVAPLGTALTEEQIMELWRIVREPVLCFDGDTAGARAAGRAAERVLPLLKPGYSLRIAELPAGDDPDTLIRRAGAEEMSRVLAKAIPLSDVLWQMETRGRMITTPEDRAALQKRLEDLTRRINDPTVRAHFLKSFKDRIWTRRNDAGSRTPGGWKRGGRAPGASMKMDGKAGPAAKTDPLRFAQRMLVAIIINHPDFFHHVEEELGSVGFDDAALDVLRQELIQILSGSSSFEGEEIRAELIRRGHGPAMETVFLDPIIRRHREIGPKAANDNLQAAWEENFQALRRVALMDEKKDSQDIFSEDMNEETWARDKALIEALNEEEAS